VSAAYVVLVRKRDRARFLYRFATPTQARAFVERNRAPMPWGLPSPYGVSEPLYREPRGAFAGLDDYNGAVRG